jgi:hypothetical protein
MKYRIIQEANLNGEYFYEVHFYEQVKCMLFFKRWKWVPSYEHKRMCGEFWVTRTARYDTLADATKVVNKRARKRIVAAEGEIEQDNSYNV